MASLIEVIWQCHLWKWEGGHIGTKMEAITEVKRFVVVVVYYYVGDEFYL